MGSCCPCHSNRNAAQPYLQHVSTGVELGQLSMLFSCIFITVRLIRSKDLNVDLARVLPTITSYLLLQGVAALFWGPLSDAIGRRRVYLYGLLNYIVASIALSFSPSVTILIVYHGMQGIGAASLVYLGGAVIQDLSESSERDRFLTFYQGIRNLAFVLAPILGGLLSELTGFRSIFISHVALSAMMFILLLLFLPETLRSIASNGSKRLRGMHQAWVDAMHADKESKLTEMSNPLDPPPKIRGRAFVEPLLLLKEKDIVLSLIYGGIAFTMWMMVTVSTAGLFRQAFGLNELMLGLAFIPNGKLPLMRISPKITCK
jgi:MFS family permease